MPSASSTSSSAQVRFQATGHTRLTNDIDVLMAPTRTNAKRMIAALEEVGYDVTELTIEQVLTKKIPFRQHILATDIIPSVGGATFTTIWKNKRRDTTGGVPIYDGSPRDLIKIKRAANRPKDREDLKALLALKKLKERLTNKKTERK